MSADEIADLYQGLKQSYLDDFHMMLTGYIPGAAAVEAVGAIAKDLKAKAEPTPGSFFWVLDPVMGDNGRIYVAEDVVPAYRSLMPHADLILPNQFEAELLSEVKITSMETLKQAIQRAMEGLKVSADEIADLYQGLKQSYLDDFHMMLTGYIPGAAAVEAVGAIAKDLKAKAEPTPGSFFWVLDPVMGDNGRIYVAEDVVPAYRSLMPHADLILPNQFEAELLSEVKITSMETLKQAIQRAMEGLKGVRG